MVTASSRRSRAGVLRAVKRRSSPGVVAAGVVAAAVDQGEALVGVRPQRGDVRLGQRLHRARPVIARVEQLDPGHGHAGEQPGQRDEADHRGRHQAVVEPAVGTPAQPPLGPQQDVTGGQGHDDGEDGQPRRLLVGGAQPRVFLLVEAVGRGQQRGPHQVGRLAQEGRAYRQALQLSARADSTSPV